MVRKKILDTLIELSERRQDEAAGVAADARRTTQKVEAMKRQLEDYRREYDAKSPKRAAGMTGVLSIERHERFVEKLDLAVVDQGRRHQHAQQVQSSRNDDLVAAQQRLKAFETLQKRQLLAAGKRQEKLEQRQTDEQASRLSHWKRSR